MPTRRASARSTGRGGKSFRRRGTCPHRQFQGQSNWSATRQLTTTAEDKIYPWVAANGGNVIVSYYTREFAGSASLEIDYAYVASNDDGASWSASTRITEQSSDPGIQFASGAFIGDYTGVAIGSDNVAHPIWTDFRGNPGVTGGSGPVTSPNQDAVTTRILLPPQ